MTEEKSAVHLVRQDLYISENELNDIVKYQLMETVSMAEAGDILGCIYEAMRPELYFSQYDDDTVFAAATLGCGIDRLAEELNESGGMLSVYTLDIICLFMLRKTYDWLASEVRKHGLCIREYRFPEPQSDEYGLILAYLRSGVCEGQSVFPVSMTVSGMLMPLKTTCFIAYLTAEESFKCHDICDSCGKADCEIKKR